MFIRSVPKVARFVTRRSLVIESCRPAVIPQVRSNSGSHQSGSYSYSNVSRASNLISTPIREYGTDPAMFCFQCEQTEGGKGCTTLGVCGKTPEVAWAQDLLVEQLKNISVYASAARKKGATIPHALKTFTLDSLFSTLTNVNFDKTRFVQYLSAGLEFEQTAKNIYIQANNGVDDINLPTKVDLSGDISEQGHAYGVKQRAARIGNEDLASLVELCTYGLKGMGAYGSHAAQLNFEDDTLVYFIQDALSTLTKAEQGQVDGGTLLKLALQIGEKNAEVMGLLDRAHQSTFGIPSPHKVRTSPVKGKAILISGHDLADLKALLEATEGTGINVYTHGEMLPAHGYPELRKFSHLAGNYGGAWQLQNYDFAMFPGPILMTTNCIIEPRKSYRDRIFTTNAVGYEGVQHITNRQFKPLIEVAKIMDGFPETDEQPKPLTVGFGHEAILANAGAIVDLVKAGKISHFFFVGGCDGSEGERSYFTKFVKATPKDSIILTAGCGKYRFNHLNLGELGETGIPRVLDLGQCNDSYGAVKVALALADAFGTTVNGLPLSLAVSWFEQKAVAVLLTLLHFGVRDIRLGPALPAFLTPNILNTLVQNYNIRPIGDPKVDVAAMLAKE